MKARRVLEVAAKRLGVAVEELKRRRRDSPLRGVAARMLCRYARLDQREVAKELDRSSGSSVSRQLTALKQRMKQDKKLSKQMEACEKTLRKERKKVQAA